MFDSILGREEPTSGFGRLVERHSAVDARKKRNIASRRHRKFDAEAEKHQQQVYEYIKEGSDRPQNERLPLAMEAKIAQFNAVVARLRSFKGLKNQLIWRLVEVRNEMPDPDSFSDDDVDVDLAALDGEMSQITDEFHHWHASVESELSELMGVLDAFDMQDGALEIEADDMLQQMADFDEETSPQEVGDDMGLQITEGVGGAVGTADVGGAGDVDVDVSMSEGMSIDSALDRMSEVSAQVDATAADDGN